MRHAEFHFHNGVMNFTDAFDRCVRSAGQEYGGPDIAGRDDVDSCLASAGATLSLADPKVVREVQDHDPSSFRVQRDRRGRVRATLAFLRLNERGASALVTGGFDPLAPSIEHLADRGAQATAIYIWLLHAPRSLRAGLLLVDAVMREQTASVPVFSHAASPDAERLHEVMGFIGADTVYPDAPRWLKAALPRERGAVPSSGNSIDVRVATRLEDVMKAFAIRSATYLSEQSCPYDEEFDGNDFAATHLVGYIDGEPAGCARVRWFGDFAKIERVAVLPAYRRSRMAFRLARASVELCRRKGFRRLYAHCRRDLVPLWQMFGMRLVPDRPAFSFSGVEFVEVSCELEPRDDAIRFGDDPMMIIRPEGMWDHPGPLDRSSHPICARSPSRPVGPGAAVRPRAGLVAGGPVQTAPRAGRAR